MILLDTDHLSVLTDRRAAGNAALVRRLERAEEPLAIPIVAVEEQCKGWLARLCGWVGATLRSACRAGAECLRQAGRAASLAWRLAGGRVRAVLLVTAVYLARTALAAAAHRLCGAARSLASRAWGALRRGLPPLGLCGT